MISSMAMLLGNDPSTTLIRNVWSDNLDHEIATIRRIIMKYPYVAMVRLLIIIGIIY